MKVTIYGKSANHPRFEQLLMKFGTGVIESGDDAFLSYDETYYPCDVAVIFGSWKDRDDTHHRVKNEIIKNAKNFIVLETPLLGRQPVQNVMPDNWYRIGLNGFLADTGHFNNHNKGSERWDIIRKNLNLSIDAYHYNHDGPIVVALQLPGDASLRGASIEKWAARTVQALRTQTDKKIIVRTPQLERQYQQKYIDLIKKQPNVEFQTGTADNLVPTLKKAFCTITYSSGLALDSLINGCPTVAMSPSSFAYGICQNTVDNIDNIKRPSRDQLMYDLSYAQWHESEIERGLPWRHLKQLIS
jgi:hypothetical protein